ncbi:MAG: TolB protein [Acidobacteriota bacterium]|jgi:Tol biopolymer transport system component|nr:TolB protein [Acidobacteriota bacterium]
MSNPRQASLKFLAALTLACLACALPLTRSAAQNAPSKKLLTNGMIVFQSTQGSNAFTNDIYVIDADGKHQTRLTTDPADDVLPIWSPRGDQIAFVTNRGGSYNIYLMNADGSNQRPLRSTGDPIYGDDIEWSPDGTKLKFVDATGRVCVIEAVTPVGGDSIAPMRNVSASAPAGAFDSSASWSPDGSRLAIISTACDSCSPHLYITSADGTWRTQLPSTTNFEARPRWSPAGGQIAYEGFGVTGRDIYVVNADGTNTHPVSGGVNSFGGPSWSPDGTQLAFRSSNGSVYAVKADGTNLMLLSAEPSSTGSIFWSPDGTRVAFHDSNGNGCVDLFVADSDGIGRKTDNYTKTKKADESASSWQRIPTP